MSSYGVLVTVHNGEKYICDALRSVMMQTLRPSQIVVIDDGSTDNTRERAQAVSSEIQIFFKEQAGQGSAINFGLSKLHTDLISFIDHDDLWPKSRSEQLVEHMDASCQVAIGQVVNQYMAQGEVLCEKNMGNARLLGACMFRKEVFARVVGFPEDNRPHAIIPWWINLERNQIRTTNVPVETLIRRIHGENEGVVNRKASRESLLDYVRRRLNDESENA